VFKAGDEVTVKVLRYNPDTERVSLGLKQTMEDPWEHAFESYPVGKRVAGRVVSLTDYGAFVEIEPGVEGLVHVSEMSWGKAKHPSRMLEVGQDVEAQVLEVDVQAKRMSLGLKQLEPDPWQDFASKYNPGDVVRGEVRSITDYGLFIGIADGVDGMVHRSDLSWTQRVANPSDLYEKGSEVEAIILSINHADKKVSLGIKQLFEDPWVGLVEAYPIGTVLEVRVRSLAEFGVFVELDRGVEGLVHASEYPDGWNGQAHGHAKPGDIIAAEITAIDPDERRIGLSFKNVGDRQADAEARKFIEQKREQTVRVGPSGGGGATLGDVMRGKLGDLSKE
jgi:small subunit ribosomal protein S1